MLERTAVADPVVPWARDLVTRRVEHLTRLVDDLLEVWRITRGKIDLHRQALDIKQVIERAVELSTAAIASQSHVLEVRVPPEPLRVEGDLERLTQAVANLLNNAAKYTSAGGRIYLDAAREGIEVRMTVHDTGQGIASDLMPRIFDPFIQGERGGLGIGLTLVKRIVELHGGRVEARSEGPGLGSAFDLRLPYDAAAEKAPSKVGAESTGKAGPRKPSSSWTTMRTRPIRSRVYWRCMATLSALHTTRRAHFVLHRSSIPRCCSSNIGLPGVSGRELTAMFRSRPDTRDALIVAITGYGRDDDIQMSHAAGFDNHLVKPVDAATLVAILGDSPLRPARAVATLPHDGGGRQRARHPLTAAPPPRRASRSLDLPRHPRW